ncbi:E2F-associated phosphoprotein [Trinorchestia longiramus]|nr:E2F-associated phosphoprotein [Trinorchestia longiramus]
MEEEYYEFSSDDENETCISHFYSSCSDSDNEDNDGFIKKIMEHHAAKSRSSKCFSRSQQPDPFEEEMADELNTAMLSLKSFGSATPPATPLSLPGPCEKSEEGKVSSTDGRREGQYESIYFDSDEDEDCEDVRQHRKTLSDADLLYDPTLDDQDQIWMDDHRRQYSSTGGSAGDGGGLSKRKRNNEDGLPQSDAVLNCPGCLSMLCTDCQRHVTYGNQYRAMFVFNCRVDRTQLLSCPAKLTKSEIKKNKKKERQLRKMMKKRKNQRQDVLASPHVNCTQRDPEADVCNVPSEVADVCTVSSGIADVCSVSSKVTDVCNASSKAVDVCDASSKAADVCDASFKAADVSNVSSEAADVSNVSSEAADVSNVSSEAADVSNVSFENSEYFLKDPTGLSSSNESKVSSHGTASPETFLVDKSAEPCGLTSGGVLKRSSGSGSSSPSKKVRFSGEIREFESEIPTDLPICAALSQSASGDVFHPVLCRHCNTKVAVFDKDEVYHFFNVITSY